MMMVLLAIALGLPSCTGSNGRLGPGFLGRQFDASPPAAAVVATSPPGVPLSQAAPSLVPDEVVDTVVANALRPWLTPLERRSLAEATQLAATAATGNPVPWQSLDPGHQLTAGGTVVAVGDVYRSLRGRACRDLRQRLDRGDEPRVQQITVCRDDLGAGLSVWVLGKVE